MTEVLNELSKEQIEFICKECGVTEEQLFAMDEDTLYDSVYDVMCDIECAETPDGNEPLSEHCAMASELVTILGNTIPADESEFDGEYFDGMRVKYTGEDDPEQLLNGKEYDVVELDNHTGWYRITNETGDDYLFPPEDFEILRDDGGPGSGNWGHEGRPGKVGGSKDGGGSHNRLKDENGDYTSFSKQKKKYAAPHKTSYEEIKKAPEGTKLICDGEVFAKVKYGYINVVTGEHRSNAGLFKQFDGKDVSFAIPDSENHNYRKKKNRATTGNGTAPGSDNSSYASFLKNKEKYAKPHQASYDEIKNAPVGTELSLDENYVEENVFVKNEQGYVNTETGEFFSVEEMYNALDSTGIEVTLGIPDSGGNNEGYYSGEGENVPYDQGRFSGERKRNAARFTTYQEADDTLREETGRVWRDCTIAEKYAMEAYTGPMYRTYNGILRGTKSYLDSEENRQFISRITDVIDRSELKQDTWLVRGVDMDGAEKLFGLKPGTLAGRDAKEMIGLTGTDKGFTSCGTMEGTGFHDDVKISIYCPSGTKAIYAEPFSRMGEGDKVNWDEEKEDGVSKQSSFSSEFETILQRGSTFQITGYKSYYGTVELEVQVISQSTD